MTPDYLKGYRDGLEAAANIAQRHIGSATKQRKARGTPVNDPDAYIEIHAEERGEDIAAEMIEHAIRSLTPPTGGKDD